MCQENVPDCAILIIFNDQTCVTLFSRAKAQCIAMLEHVPEPRNLMTNPSTGAVMPLDHTVGQILENPKASGDARSHHSGVKVGTSGGVFVPNASRYDKAQYYEHVFAESPPTPPPDTAETQSPEIPEHLETAQPKTPDTVRGDGTDSPDLIEQ